MPQRRIQNPRGKGYQRHLGSYATADVAARVYDRAVLKLRGKGAELNFPLADYEADAFMQEHVGTDRIKFLDLLRARFSLQVGGQQRPRRAAAPATADEEEEEAPESPRTRTVSSTCGNAAAC